MIVFITAEFVATLNEIARLEEQFEYLARLKVSEKNESRFRLQDFNVIQIMGNVSKLECICIEHGFNSAIEKCQRIEARLRSWATIPVKFPEASSLLRDLRERIEDDLKNHLFTHLSPSEAEFYTIPLKDWEIAVKRFPKVALDVEESSKCFALGRYAASIFHVLLVAEYGLIQVAKLLNVAGDKPGWGSLQRLEKILKTDYKDRSLLQQEHSALLSNVVPLTAAIKDSWRHKISHVENKLVWLDADFSPQIAEEIISAVRGFMRRLASDMPI